MKTKHQYLLLFYWGILFLDCFFIYSQREEFRLGTKSLLMPLLLLYYLANCSKRHHLPSKILTSVALLLALAGDVCLLMKGESFFITGLLLFLAMHAIYIVYFWRIHPLFPIKVGLHFFLPIFLVGIFDTIVMTKIIPVAGSMGTPLIAYMAVVSFMFIMAFNILSSKKAKSLATNFFIPGAAMFLVSDAILGLNIFLWEDTLIGIAVMLTYGYAQHLMVHGFIKHIRGRI